MSVFGDRDLSPSRVGAEFPRHGGAAWDRGLLGSSDARHALGTGLPAPMVSTDVRNVLAAPFALEPSPTLARYFLYPSSLRTAGAHLLPLNEVVIVYASGAPSRSASRPVSSIAIDVDRSRATFGAVVARQPAIAALRRSGVGFDQATYWLGDGSQNAVFLFSDPVDGERVRLLEADGSTGRVSPATIRGLPADVFGRPTLSASVRPALTRDAEARPGRVFIAFIEPSRRVVVGFLERSGGWAFRATGSVDTPARLATLVPSANLAAASDLVRHEYGVCWCVGEAGFFARFDSAGRPLTSVPLQAFEGSGDMGIDGGALLAINTRTGRYLFQIQHNAYLLEPFAGGARCLAERSNTPIPIDSAEPICHHGTGEDVWPRDTIAAGFGQESGATAEVYVGQWEFRAGGPRASGPRVGAGASLVRRASDPFLNAWVSLWAAETDPGPPVRAGELWPPGAPEVYVVRGDHRERIRAAEATMLQRYVRAPGAHLSVAVSVTSGSYNPVGQLRYTFLRDELGPGEREAP